MNHNYNLNDKSKETTMTDPVQKVAADLTAAKTFLAKQTAWVAANPKKTVLLWLASLAAVALVAHIL